MMVIGGTTTEFQSRLSIFSSFYEHMCEIKNYSKDITNYIF